jgi:hypothetical protein
MSSVLALALFVIVATAAKVGVRRLFRGRPGPGDEPAKARRSPSRR